MPHINIVILAGHLTRDCELRYTPKGTPVGEFGLAINRTWKNEAGEKQEEVSFFNCVCFGRTAENISQYFHKGSAIMVEGRLKQETWEDKHDGGKKRSTVKVIIEKFHFVSAKSSERGDDESTPARAPAKPSTAAAPPADDSGRVADDDVPF